MKCGECTLCCTLFPVNWLDKPINTDCKYCDQGCSIHNTKPSECTDYNCMYIQEDSLPVELRPDNSGIIFDRITNKIIYGVLDPKKKPSDIARRQIGAFMEQGFSVVLSSINKIDNGYFISPSHKEKHIRRDFTKHLIKKYGRIRN